MEGIPKPILGPREFQKSYSLDPVEILQNHHGDEALLYLRKQSLSWGSPKHEQSFKNAILKSFGQQPLKHNNLSATPAELQYRVFYSHPGTLSVM